MAVERSAFLLAWLSPTPAANIRAYHVLNLAYRADLRTGHHHPQAENSSEPNIFSTVRAYLQGETEARGKTRTRKSGVRRKPIDGKSRGV